MFSKECVIEVSDNSKLKGEFRFTTIITLSATHRDLVGWLWI